MVYSDYFSQSAELYCTYRPTYPTKLFDYLTSLCSKHSLAWDVATGNGQAALPLADRFEKVIATDISVHQLEQALRHPRITYCVSNASSGELHLLDGTKYSIVDSSVDLITVAQAYHWLEHGSFHKEAERVLAPGGIFAVWCYNLLQVSPQIDLLTTEFYHKLEEYWPPQRRLLEREYADIPLPFEELPAPEFVMEASWDVEHFLGYIRTWSAVQCYIKKHGSDPVVTFKEQVETLWHGLQPVRWTLKLRLSRKN
ncbi:MAG: class I SAM-dependent methyltransferase [Acidobacteriota bacterium]|nr:class I SAM-dependent methyltransferase [Blastocatellia bacterium]MDW8411515.1 class I SAM-dependent methyltransferase [Acidobacteriota bacterium]